MQYILISALVASFWILSYFITKRVMSRGSDFQYSQSYIHQITVSMLDKKPKKVKSQSQILHEKNTIKIAISEDKAYWVEDNAFFTADIVDGYIDKDNAQQINSTSLSESEVKKMLKILDSLKEE